MIFIKHKMRLLFLLSSFSIFANAYEIIGKVTKVVDGDTIHVLADNVRYKIRLASIDAPERNQPLGEK